MSLTEVSFSPVPSLEQPGVDLWVVRHGFAEHNNNPDRLDGNGMSHLDGNGHFQAVQAGAYLATLGLDVVIYGTKERIAETYRAAAESLEGIPAFEDNRLNEQDYADMAGRSKKEVFRDDAFKARAAIEGYDVRIHPKAESGRQVHDRAMRAIIGHAVATVGRPVGRNIRVAAFTSSATAKNIAGMQTGLSREDMFAQGAYPMANGAIWELRPGYTAPLPVFTPRNVTPATVPRRSEAA